MKLGFLTCGFLVPLLWLVGQERWHLSWIPFSGQTCGFRAEFPIAPRESMDKLTPWGNDWRLFQRYLARDAGVGYLVAYVDLRKGEAAETACKTLERHTKELLSWRFTAEPQRTALSIGGHPAVELRGRLRQGACARTRVCLAGSRLFVVQVSGTPAAVDSRNADRFLASFRVCERWWELSRL